MIEVVKIYFPEEIIVEILIRLPVWSLVRFKCVSKSWKTLITSDYFKVKHCNHARNNKMILIARCDDPEADSYAYYSSSLSSGQPLQKLRVCPSNHLNSEMGSGERKNVGRPRLSKHPNTYCQILCCCDGLSLLLCGDGGFLLWNPSINESIQIPNFSANSTYEEASIGTYGMGYDSISDDYKILFNISHIGGDNKILALKSGSWRKIDKYSRAFHNYSLACTHTALFYREDSLAFVHGAFHWISNDNLYKNFMISFNISNEMYKEMSLPDGICKIPNMVYIRRGLSAIQGKLYAYCTCMDEEGSIFKVWVMKEYGVAESWTRLFTIRERSMCLTSVVPKYVFEDGEMLLMYKNHCFVRGFRTSKGPFDLFPACNGFQQGFVYSESLISPKLLI